MPLRTSQEQALLEAWTRTYSSGRVTPSLSTATHPASMTDRGAADALAAWRRWHDATQQARFTENEQYWFSLLERARVETLASQELAGIAHNLKNPATTAPANMEMAALYQAARLIFQGLPSTSEILLDPSPQHTPKNLLKRAMDQMLGRQTARQPTQSINDNQLKEWLRLASQYVNDSSAFALSVEPMVQELARFYHSPSASPQTSASQALGEEEEVEEDESASEVLTASGLSDELAERDDQKQHYAVFSRHWDIENPLAIGYSIVILRH